jgi:hypothetical protein
LPAASVESVPKSLAIPNPKQRPFSRPKHI